MRIGKYKIRPRIVLLLLLGLPAVLFVRLGLWQLDRAEEKRHQAEALAERERMAPLLVQELEADPAAIRYRRVRVTGELEAQNSFFIENRHHAGRTGFHVITPLRQSGSDIRVLVNRGWVAADRNNQPPAVATPGGEVTVTGTADLPSPPALSLVGPESARSWGKRWPYLTVQLYAAGVDHPVQGFTILEDPADAHGFVRAWPREMPKEGMHLGYAIQWFAFAAISLGFFVKLSLEKTAPRELSA